METEYTYFHSIRLKEYCLAIGRRLKLSDNELELLDKLAKYHDIGKCFIDSGILNKPDRLTSAEWTQMRKHPHFGSAYASEHLNDSMLARLILYHHERWDGKGYPGMLYGRKIPLLDRILIVVDAYDAMTNGRIYREAMSHRQAVNELKRNAGTQFDPEIVKIFLECVKDPDKLTG